MIPDCPVCGIPSEVVRIWTERGVERAIVRCLMNHWVALDLSELPNV